MDNRIALTAALAVVLTASACAPASTTPPAATPASSAPVSPNPVPSTSPATASAATGWELSPKGAADRIKAAGLQVLTAEGAAEHFHAHLDVFMDGKPVAVPADIGFSFNSAGQPNGISALHSHDQSGVIHIEAPTSGATYTLGQFLAEWGVLDGTDKTQGTAHSDADGWTVAVNGTRQDGRITDVVLKAHDEIVLFHGTPPDPIPASFTFTGGL
ncbi:hypothetical protein NG819_13560 [Pseudarthrobacter sp. Fe7]|nr:hypothetical protein NG819_13560 [Pseudarthrobacter sp. Fe7]